MSLKKCILSALALCLFYNFSFSSTKRLGLSKPKKTFTAKLLRREVFTGDKSDYLACLLEFSLDSKNIHYEQGDVLGVYPKNSPEYVDHILKLFGLTGREHVHEKSIYDILLEDLDLNRLRKNAYKFFIKIKAIDESELTSDALHGSDLLKKLNAQELKGRVSAEKIVTFFKKIRPRYYCLASSQLVNRDTLQLLVRLHTYELGQEKLEGLCSSYLCKRLKPLEEIKCFLRKSHFKLPEESSSSIIMVGPGTGIAPFKAFLEEKASLYPRKYWLFFGTRYTEDYLPLLVQFRGYVHSGLLSRFDCAFSRTQKEKIYVQHKLLENAQEIWKWLNAGAYFYVCGEGKHMAKDVEEALLKIIIRYGEKTPKEAQEFLNLLRSKKFYKRSVY